MGSALNESAAIRHFKYSNSIEICNKITLDFYTYTATYKTEKQHLFLVLVLMYLFPTPLALWPYTAFDTCSTYHTVCSGACNLDVTVLLL